MLTALYIYNGLCVYPHSGVILQSAGSSRFIAADFQALDFLLMGVH